MIEDDVHRAAAPGVRDDGDVAGATVAVVAVEHGPVDGAGLLPLVAQEDPDSRADAAFLDDSPGCGRARKAHTSSGRVFLPTSSRRSLKSVKARKTYSGVVFVSRLQRKYTPP